tara:strand:- start:42 stop:380 length:339 start_codon:yes stop_codon:yes gene_type:complete
VEQFLHQLKVQVQVVVEPVELDQMLLVLNLRQVQQVEQELIVLFQILTQIMLVVVEAVEDAHQVLLEVLLLRGLEQLRAVLLEVMEQLVQVVELVDQVMDHQVVVEQVDQEW